MIPFFGRQHIASLKCIPLIACMICIVINGGCRKAAYTELYVEQLNNEARLLEDRIYEYDSAFRELELEVRSLHSENERLRSQINSGQSPVLRSRKSPPQVEFEEIPSKADSSTEVVPKEKTRSERPQNRPPPTPKEAPKVIESEQLEPPMIEMPSPPSILNDDTSSTDAVGTSVDYLAVNQSHERRSVSGAEGVIQAVAVATLPQELEQQENDEVDATEDVENHEDVGLNFPIDVDSNIEKQQAYTPHLASADSAGPSVANSGTEQQVIELMFHPAFTRAIDADKEPGEESIRMIVQPKLASGKVVPVDGHLTIVVVDPNATNPDNAEAPVSLGRWTFTPEQLQQYFDPIGSANGYRFEMGPLQSKPVKSELIIFVRLEYEDGRKLVNQFTIHPDSNPSDKPIWTARAK